VVAAGEYADETGLIVSVDSKPAYPSVHNGWVKLGKTLGKINGFKIRQIERHVEKPKSPVAKKLFKEGGWLINTGYRVWKSDMMLSYYQQYQPEMYKGLMKITDSWGTKNQKKVLKSEYKKFISESIEYGIFEKLPSNVRGTIAADMGWEDVGISWELFYQGLKTKSKDNVVEGGADTELIDAKNNLIIAPKGKVVGLIGVQNLVVIDTPDGLLVCNMNDTQKVKDLYTSLEKNYEEYTT
jgi:mannose-1-phosphate guanylyltransferase